MLRDNTQLLRCTSVQHCCMHNPDDGTLGLVELSGPLLLNGQHSCGSMPACLMSTRIIPTFTIEINKLTYFETLALTSTAPCCTKDASAAVCFEESLSSQVCLFKRGLKGLIAHCDL